MILVVVVPGYYLAWYNTRCCQFFHFAVVVPGYYLAWYNIIAAVLPVLVVVVPGYYLAWYNPELYSNKETES